MTPRPRTSSGAVGSAMCRMPLLLFSSKDEPRVTKGTGVTLRDGDQKVDGSETAAFWSALGSVMSVALDRPEILYATKTVGSSMQSPTKSAGAKHKRLVRLLLGLLQARCAEVPGCARRHRLGRRRGADTLDHWSDRDLRRSSARRLRRRRNHWSRCPARKQSPTLGKTATLRGAAGCEPRCEARVGQ